MSILRYKLSSMSREEQRRALANTITNLEQGSAYIVGNVLFVLSSDRLSLLKIRNWMQDMRIPQFAR